MHSDNEPMRKKIITILFAVFLFISSENASPTAFNIYKVKKGDTLYSISKKFQISLEILKKTNPKVTASGLKTGFLLKIPCNIVTQNGSEEFREIRFEPATTRRRNNTKRTLWRILRSSATAQSLTTEGESLSRQAPKGPLRHRYF